MSEVSATVEGTKQLAGENGGGVRYRRLGRTGLTVSVLGFGGYRVDDETLEHHAAIDQALRAGCNLIDTSTNYTDGGSERLVGKVLREGFSREQIVLVSKVGYVQGQNLSLAKERETEGNPFPEIVRYMEGCWHCLSPEFIEDQLTRSLKRLQVACLDVYLLHNPEYFFSDCERRRDPRSLAQRREVFYDRVSRAFAHLEKEAERGRIRYYGVSSNTFGEAESEAEATSLSHMWEVAEKFGQHHFGVVQLPMNLFESGPALEKNNHGKTVLEFAKEKDLAVLVNRPLNAIVKSQMFRLADFPKKPVPGTLAENLNRVSKLEEEFTKTLAPRIETTDGAMQAGDFYRWSRELAALERQPIGLEQWGQLESQVLYQNQYVEKQLDGYFGVTPIWRDWRSRYTPQLKMLLDAFHNECAERSQRTSTALAKKLDPLLPEEMRKESLSRKALAVMIDTPGTTCVLNGMRQPLYVEDAMGAAKLPELSVTPEMFEAFRY